MAKKLLAGKTDDIIKSNQQTLCEGGMSEAQAWHLAMKKANKSTKTLDKAVKGVVAKKRNNMEIK